MTQYSHHQGGKQILLWDHIIGEGILLVVIHLVSLMRVRVWQVLSMTPVMSAARLITPPIILGSTTTSCSLKFYMMHDPGYATAPDSIKIEISTNGTTFTQVTVFNRYSSTQGWVEHTVYLGNLSGTIYIGFLAYWGSGNNMNIDYVRLVGVPYQPQIDIGIDTIISPGATYPVNIPMTITARLRRYSGGGPTQNFPAICSIIGANGALRYTNTQTVTWIEPADTARVNFASWTPTLTELCTVKLRILYPDSNPANNRKTRTTQIYINMLYEGFNGTTFPPLGWQAVIINGTYNWQRYTSGTYPTCTPYEGDAMAGYPAFTASAGNCARLISPPMYVSYTTHVGLRFWMMHDPGYATAPDSIKIETSTNCTTFTQVTAFNRYAPIQTWTEHTVYLGNFSSDYYVSFNALSGYGNNMYIDWVRVMPTGISEEKLNNSSLITMLNPPKPNPITNGLIQLSFTLAEPSQVALKIYDASGRLVKALVDEVKNSGVYNVSWNCRDDCGREVPEGVYFYTLQTGNYNSTKKPDLDKIAT